MKLSLPSLPRRPGTVGARRRGPTSVRSSSARDTDAGALWIPASDGVMRPFMEERGTWEPEEGALLSEFFRPGLRFLDVGANVGYFSLFVAQRCPGASIHAFEPHPLTSQVLGAQRLGLGRRHHAARPGPVGRRPAAALTTAESNLGDTRQPRRRVRDDALAGRTARRGAAGRGLRPGQDRRPGLRARGRRRHGRDDRAAAPASSIVAEFWPAALRERGLDPVAVLTPTASSGLSSHVIHVGEDLSVMKPVEVVAHLRPGRSRRPGQPGPHARLSRSRPRVGPRRRRAAMPVVARAAVNLIGCRARRRARRPPQVSRISMSHRSARCRRPGPPVRARAADRRPRRRLQRRRPRSPSTLDRIPADFRPRIAEVFVCDDASPDRTYLVGLGYQGASADLPVSVVRNERNLGYGGNQKAGYRLAAEHDLDIIVMLHADGQYAPEFLPAMVEPLVRGEADAVFGSRMMEKGAARRGGMPAYKFVGNKILTRIENTAARLGPLGVPLRLPRLQRAHAVRAGPVGDVRRVQLRHPDHHRAAQPRKTDRGDPDPDLLRRRDLLRQRHAVRRRRRGRRRGVPAGPDGVHARRAGPGR